MDTLLHKFAGVVNGVIKGFQGKIMNPFSVISRKVNIQKIPLRRHFMNIIRHSLLLWE